MLKPQVIVQRMLAEDAFSQWLAIEVTAISEGTCIAKMTIQAVHCNGFGVCHGGVTFSFADSVFAFASNSRGRHAVSVDTHISHLKAVQVGDTLRAEAQEEHLGKTLANYVVKVVNQREEMVALFRGTVFRKRTEWT